MSLPPALAARLAKRGLITKAPQRPQPEPKFEEQEEVIAEDYDDVTHSDVSNLPLPFSTKMCPTVPGCPNKYNIYHNCTGFCVMKYAAVPTEPPKSIKKKFARLLKKYPLKELWEQVYEPGLKTYYFWNTQTDQVSWLPPSHPDAKISLPAEKLRSLLRDDSIDGESEDEKKDNDDNSSNEDNSDDSEDDSESDDSSSSEPEEDIVSRAKRQRQGLAQSISRRNDLDPMDPAAYSNAPRGKWSDGLRNDNDDD